MPQISKTFLFTAVGSQFPSTQTILSSVCKDEKIIKSKQNNNYIVVCLYELPGLWSVINDVISVPRATHAQEILYWTGTNYAICSGLNNVTSITREQLTLMTAFFGG